jgi:hypothetical protein
MPQSVFGVGFLFATPAGANATPTRFGALQDVTVDFSFDTKLLYGSSQFALEQARGKGKIDIKAAIGRVDPNLFNNIFFGLSTSVGETLNSIDETGVITAGAVTVANASTWTQDLGVYNVATGLYMTRVASAPSGNQYAVTGGAYTFNASLNGDAVRISYVYSSTTTGTRLAYTNQPMGSNAIFSMTLVNQFAGVGGRKSLFMSFPAVQASKLSMPLKLDDFTLTSLDMGAQDDGSGNVFSYSMTG